MRKMPNDVEKLDRISGSIDADEKGNAKVEKDLTIDGNLKFKSLVSADNPNGIFDPSSGGTGGGGGGGGIPRHGYMVDFRDSCYYIVYTTKDYNFPIGQRTELIADFKSNDEYKDLRYNGFYPAAGYLENIRPAVKLEILNNGTFRVWIYNTSSSKYTFVEVHSDSLKFYITKLF